MKNTISPLLLAFALLVTHGQAFAYLDAGTGSMIIQGIIGAVVAGLYIIRMYWHRLLTFLGIRKKSVDETGIETANVTEHSSTEDLQKRSARRLSSRP